MSSNLYLMNRDQSGAPTFGLPVTPVKKSVTLPTSTATSFTVPSYGKNWNVLFSRSSGGDIWVSFDGNNAEVPAGGTFADTNSELNPSDRRVASGTTVSVITSGSGVGVGVTMYVYD